MKEALKLALELKNSASAYWTEKEILIIEKLIDALAQPEQAPVAHSVIAGALFDFMGWLTSRKERIVLSSADNASPAVDAIRDFANMRGLSLDDAKVLDWNTTPPKRLWVGLTAQQAADCWTTSATKTWHNFEAALKKKNT